MKITRKKLFASLCIIVLATAVVIIDSRYYVGTNVKFKSGQMVFFETEPLYVDSLCVFGLSYSVDSTHSYWGYDDIIRRYREPRLSNDRFGIKRFFGLLSISYNVVTWHIAKILWVPEVDDNQTTWLARLHDINFYLSSDLYLYMPDDNINCSYVIRQDYFTEASVFVWPYFYSTPTVVAEEDKLMLLKHGSLYEFSAPHKLEHFLRKEAGNGCEYLLYDGKRKDMPEGRNEYSLYMTDILKSANALDSLGILNIYAYRRSLRSEGLDPDAIVNWRE